MSLVEVLPVEQLRTTETALELAPNLTVEQWEEIGHTLGRANRASAWWIGDWLNYGEAKWGEKYSEAEQITELAYKTLSEYANTARRFPISDRIGNLTYGHHRLVAPIESPNERRELLARAADEGWGREDLRAHLAPRKPTKISPQKRHAAYVDAADTLVRIGEKWEHSMTDTLTPPQAKKQLTTLRKAHSLLGNVIEAVEYRADTLHTFLGR